MSENNYKFESFVEYHGTVENVQKMIDKCQVCGSKLMLTHLPDYKNLLVQETARCLECGSGNRKVIHILN
jgi:hypothetical protein